MNIKRKNNLQSYLANPANVITVVFLIALVLMVALPLCTLLIDSLRINGNQEAIYVGDGATDGDFTLHHWWELLFSKEFNYARIKFWRPLYQSAIMALLACVVAVGGGGVVAWFITRSDLPGKKFISTVFVFPYIMPSWSMAMFWENFFKNTAINAGKGILKSGLWPNSLRDEPGTALRTVCVYFDRRHSAKHGRQSRRGRDGFKSKSL